MSFKNAHLPIQKDIFNYTKTNVEFETITAVVASSRLNNIITERDIEQEPGKLRTFKLNIVAPNCDDSGDCTDDLCTPGTRTQPVQEYFTLQRCTASPKFEFQVNDARELENIGTNEYALAQLRANLNTVRKKLATQIATLLISRIGVHGNGQATRNISLVNNQTGALNSFGINEIKREYADLNLTQEPFLLGGYSVFHLRNAMTTGLAGLSQNGINLARVAIPNLYYDNLVNTIIGSGENILTWDPNYLKFLTFSKNAGRFATNLKEFKLGDAYQSGDEYLYTTIVDQQTGIIWDLDAIFDKCTKTWRFQYKLNWDIFFLPAQVCLPAGVNGIMRYTGCEPVETPCVEGEPLAPAIAATTYAWTPSGEALPEYVAELTLAGRSFKPRVNVTTVADWVALLNGLNIGTFTLVSGSVRYSGFSAMTGTYNIANAITFAAV